MALNGFRYVKNVGKSLGYSAIDVLKSYNPAITTMASGAKEFGSDLYQSIDSFKADLKSTKDDKNWVGTVKSISSDLWTNLVEDAKSGNWYNKARIDKAENSAMLAMMGFDEGDDPFAFDLDDFDFDSFDDDDSISEDTQVTVASQKENTTIVVQAMDAVGAKAAGAIATSNIRSAQYIAESNRETSKALYKMHQKGYQSLASGLAAINANISQLVTLGEPLTAHMQNAAIFYTKLTEYQQKSIELLEKIVANTTVEEPKKSSISKTTLSHLMDDGVLNLSSYADYLKESIGKYKKELDEMTDMFGGIEGIGKMVTSSPLKFATEGIIKTIIPSVMKESMESFNKTLQSFFTGAINKAQKTDFSNRGFLGGLFESIKGVILPPDTFTSTISTSNYNKGRVAWDGISRKALIEVIPTQLAQIQAALTGGPVMLYDYDRGKFVSRSNIASEAASMKQKYANRAGGDFRDDIIEIINKSQASTGRKDEAKKQVDAYFLKAFESGEGFYNILKEDFKEKDYGLDEETLALMREVLRSYGKNHKVSRALEFASNVRNERESYGQRIRNLSNSGVDPELYLFNDSDKFGNRTTSGGLIGKDQYNHDIFFYLQGIYQYTGHLSDNIGLFGSGGSYKKRGSIKGKGSFVPVRDLTKEMTEEEIKTAQERIKAEEEAAAGRSYSFTADGAVDETVTGKRKVKKELERKEGETDEEFEERKRHHKAAQDTVDFLSKYKKSEDGVLGKGKKKVGSITKSIHDLFNVPAQTFQEILQAGENTMYRMIYGAESSDEPGLFEYFYEKFDSLWDKIDNHLNTRIKDSFRNLWSKMFGDKDENGNYSGGFGSNIANDFRSGMNSAKEFLFGSVVDTFGTRKMRRARRQAQQNTPTAAHGRNVTQTGLVAVSRGELIIPSELNPFYHGVTNKAKQIRDERTAINRFYGSFADGGTVGQDGRGSTSSQNVDEGFRYNFFDFLLEGGAKLGTSAVDFFKRLIGIDPDKVDEEHDILNDRLKSVMEEAFGNVGSMGAGALIGGGVSVLTGGIVGPLAGAAIGAGVGLIAKSKKVQDILFGEDLGEGKRGDNGAVAKVFGKKFSDFLINQVPGMAKGASVGAIGGLFMGSPILGAIVGSTASYISSSETTKNYLFGDFVDGERVGGVIPKHVQDHFKKALPNMGAGAIAGLLAGPFGLAGNLVVGAGVGYLSTTETFKNIVFGEEKDGKRDGGIVQKLRVTLLGDKDNDKKGLKDWFKEDLFDPTVGIFQKVGREIEIHSRNLWHSMGQVIRRQLMKAWGSRAMDRIKQSRVGKAIGAVGRAGVGLAKLPFKGLSAGLHGIDDALERRALRRGYNVYNSKDKRMMTAAERMARRDHYKATRGLAGIRNQNQQNFDTMLSGIESEEELNELNEMLQRYYDPTKQYEEDYGKAGNALANSLDSYALKSGLANGLADEDIAQMIKYAQKGKNNKFEELLKGSNLNEDQQKNIRERLAEVTKAREGIATAKKDRAKARKDLNMRENILKKYGYDIGDDGDTKNLLDMIEAERWKFKNPKEEKKDDKKSEDETAENVTTINDKVTEAAEDVKALKTFIVDGKVGKDSATSPIEKKLDELGDRIVTAVTGSSDPHKRVMNIGGTVMEVDTDTGELAPSNTESKNELAAVREREETQDTAMKVIAGEANGKKGGIFGALGGLLSGLFSGGARGLKNLAMSAGKNLLGAFGGSLAMYMIASGKLDGVADAVTRIFGNEAENSKGGAMKSSTHINEDGEVESINDGLGRRSIIQAAKGFLTGESGIWGTGLENTALGRLGKFSVKQLKNTGSRIKNFFTKGAGNAASEVSPLEAAEAALDVNSMRPGVMKSVMDGLTTVFAKIATKVPDSFKSKVVKFIDKSTELITNAIMKTGATKEGTKRLLKSLAAPLKIFTIVIDFVTGFQDAESILGITEEPGIMGKFLAGLLKALWGCLPIISIIPESVVVDIFFKVLKMLNINVFDETIRLREEATREVEEYNKLTGNSYTVKEYNKYVKGDWTVTERMGNWFKNLFSKKDKNESGAGTRRAFVGGASGIRGRAGMSANTFISQLDGKYRDIPYSNSTIGDIGCAPAVATMLINQIKPGTMSMENAINHAQAFKDTNGTTADYFGDILGKSGIASSYFKADNSSGQQTLLENLRAGKPTILLGRNINNRNKDLSPFGANRHFVIAKYMDKNGNVIVDDPEASGPNKVYNSSILKNVSLGISTPSNLDGDPRLGSSASGGAINYDTEVARQVWGYFTGKGYSPEVTAGIMGNMYAESGLDPTKLQNPSKNAAGIVQWENYKNQSKRWKVLSDYAASRGKDWTDLASQLNLVNAEITGDGSVPGADTTYTPGLFKKRYGSIDAFKQVTNILDATDAFCRLFERPKHPNISTREQYANQYYKLYNGSAYTGQYDPTAQTVAATATGVNENGEIETGSQEPEKLTLGDILSKLSGIFTDAFTTTIGGNEEEESVNGSSSSTGTNSDVVVNENAVGGTGTSKQKQLVQALAGLRGRVAYSMSGARNPDQGSADCSSTVNWAYKKIFGKDIGNNTLSILTNKNTEAVDIASNMDPVSGGSNSSGPNLSKLQPGDLMLYSRPKGDYTKGRQYRVGHVEMYMGDGTRIGHGGPGPGPNVSDAMKDSNRYIMSKRLIGVESAGGSGLLSGFRNGKYSGGASSLSSSLITSSGSPAARYFSGNKTSSTSGADNATLQTLVALVQSLVSNTSSIPNIANTLTNYCGTKVATDVQDAKAATATAAAANKAAQEAKKANPQDDPGLQDLMNNLNLIAVG